jgi:hypothetical protein
LTMNILEHESVASEWLSGIDLAGRTVTVVITGVEEVTVPEPRTGKALRKVAVAFPGRTQAAAAERHQRKGARQAVRAGDRRLDGQGRAARTGERTGVWAGALRCARCGRCDGEDAATAAGRRDRSGGLTNQGGTLPISPTT